MSQSRINFIESHRALSLASINPVTFDNPNDPDQDLCAKLFRRSIAVSIFSTLETFIKDRTNEVLSAIDPHKINFSSLPEGVQKAATQGAVKALNFRLQMLEKTQKQNFAIQEAVQIASVASTSYKLSSLSFGHDKSNLSSDDIEMILQSFQIDSPWAKIKIIATRVGFGGAVSYEEIFKLIATQRHLCAHTTSAKVSQSDIVDSLPMIYAIAISFDLMISKCLQLIKDKDLDYLGNGSKKFSLDPTSLPFSRIEYSNGKWRYKANKSAKALKTDNDKNNLFVHASIDCEKKKMALVEFAANGQPIRWKS